MRARLSAVLDVALLVSSVLAIYTLAGGEIRWTTPYFRFRATSFDRPLFMGLGILALKTAFGLNQGLFARLARSRPLRLGRLAEGIHRGELGLRGFFLANTINIALSATVLVLLLASLEVFLRYFPHRVPQALANHIATGYSTKPSGIYRFNPAMKMVLMRPHYEREMYFNGYRWHHKTDSLGFRNPVDRSSAHVVLLGDSMVYGHGVEETSTVRHHLEAILRKPVANLGIQGASIHQEYQILRRFGMRLQPKFVFLFFLHNDLADLTVYLTDEEMRRFLALPIADHATPYFEMRPSSHLPRLGAYLDDIYVVKAYEFLRKSLKSFGLQRAAALDEGWQSLAPFPGNPRLALAMHFHLHALLKMHDLSQTHGFRFTNVFTYTEGFGEQRVYERILESFCRSRGIGFTSLREDFEAALRSGEQLFLRGDGHFADGGARLAAKLIARQITDQRGAP